MITSGSEKPWLASRKVVLNVWSLPSTSKNEKSYIVVWAPGKKKLPSWEHWNVQNPTNINSFLSVGVTEDGNKLAFKHISIFRGDK